MSYNDLPIYSEPGTRSLAVGQSQKFRRLFISRWMQGATGCLAIISVVIVCFNAIENKQEKSAIAGTKCFGLCAVLSGFHLILLTAPQWGPRRLMVLAITLGLAAILALSGLFSIVTPVYPEVSAMAIIAILAAIGTNRWVCNDPLENLGGKGSSTKPIEGSTTESPSQTK